MGICTLQAHCESPPDLCFFNSASFLLREIRNLRYPVGGATGVLYARRSVDGTAGTFESRPTISAEVRDLLIDGFKRPDTSASLAYWQGIFVSEFVRDGNMGLLFPTNAGSVTASEFETTAL
jgi:hypothetical protein